MKIPATRRRPLPRRTATGALTATLLAFPVLGGSSRTCCRRAKRMGQGIFRFSRRCGVALTGCAGHLLTGRILLYHETLLQACAAFSRGLLPAAPSPDGGSTGDGKPPSPVLPLVSSYFALYAGLGGWVDGVVLAPARRFAASRAAPRPGKQRAWTRRLRPTRPTIHSRRGTSRIIDLLKNLFHPIFDLLAATLTTFHGWGALWWLSIAMLAARRDHETARRVRGRPLGGFLSALVQLPIFMAYYYTIQRFEALDSFRTGGLFWFQDLTVADPYLILPVAYILTVMDAQEIAIRGATPQQKNLMRLLPVVFGLFRFPTELIIYWVTSNVITFFQNLIH